MVRLLFAWCAFFFLGNAPAEAVTLRVETASGDSVFFASVRDTVSVLVSVDSDGQVLTGVEVFLHYDPRNFSVVDTLKESLLFGRVLIDTNRVLSESVAVLHFAEADLVGKSAAGVLFAADFVVLESGSLSSFSLLEGDLIYKSAYTTVSEVGVTFAFENVHSLTYADLPPVLQLPSILVMKEDEVLVVDLRPLAIDVESGDALQWSVLSSGDRVTSNVTDRLTVVLTPTENFNGQVILEMVVTDASGGQVRGEVVLNVASVNDPPELKAGALPDSVVLTDRNALISLKDAALDVDGDDLIWTGQGTDDVGIEIDEQMVAQIFAPLDWVGEATVFVFVSDGSTNGFAHSIRVVRRQASNILPGDFDGNGEVGFPDFLAFAQAFGQDNPSSEADLNGDGRVDFSDFLVFAQNFGRKS
jgi:hypothetical protein